MTEFKDFYTREFFITNDYETIIDTQLKQISLENSLEVKKLLTQILSIDDIYILLYFLTKIQPTCNYIDNEILQQFKNVNIQCKNALFNFFDFEDYVNNSIYNKLSPNIRIDTFISTMCDFNLSTDNIAYIRKYFGFSQIFKYFKLMIEKIFVTFISSSEIHFMLILLDNYDLVLSLFNPIFRRTSLYVSKQIIDINIIQCVNVIRAVCLFDASIFKNFPDYILSLNSFIVQIFYDPQLLEFFSLSDCDLLLESVRTFLDASKDNLKIKNVSVGIYEKIFDKISEFVERDTTVFEEYILIVCLFDLLYVFYEFSYEHGSRMYNFNDLFLIIKGIKLVFPSAIDSLSKKAVLSRFLERKYKIIDAIIPHIENKEDICSIIRNDLIHKGVCIYVLKNLNNIYDYIDWNDLISFACVTENTEDFVNFIFDERFTSNKDYDHCENLLIYIENIASTNSQDLLLFCTKQFTERYCQKQLTTKQIQTLFELYLYNIESINDNRVQRRRELLLSFIHYHVDKKMSETLLFEFLSKLFSIKYFVLNANILILILILAKNNKNINEELLNDLTQYFLDAINAQYKKEKKLCSKINIYLSVLVEILRFHDKEIFFMDDDFHVCSETYIKLLVGLLCCISKEKNCSYFEKLRMYLLKYLFYAEDEEKHNLHIIISYYDEQYAEGHEDKHSDLLEICKFINSRIDIL